MMDERIQIWNLLHDGEITAVAGEGGQTLTMFVSVPFLRRRLAPLGDSFVIVLSGLTLLEFHDFAGTKISLAEELEIGTPEILSTESESMPIKIETTMGQLTLSFQSIRFTLDTGGDIEYEAIARVCEEYWADWNARAEQRAASDARDART